MWLLDFFKEFCEAIGKSEDLSDECEDLRFDRNDINLNMENNNDLNLFYGI